LKPIYFLICLLPALLQTSPVLSKQVIPQPTAEILIGDEMQVETGLECERCERWLKLTVYSAGSLPGLDAAQSAVKAVAHPAEGVDEEPFELGVAIEGEQETQGEFNSRAYYIPLPEGVFAGDYARLTATVKDDQGSDITLTDERFFVDNEGPEVRFLRIYDESIHDDEEIPLDMDPYSQNRTLIFDRKNELKDYRFVIRKWRESVDELEVRGGKIWCLDPVQKGWGFKEIEWEESCGAIVTWHSHECAVLGEMGAGRYNYCVQATDSLGNVNFDPEIKYSAKSKQR